MKKDPSSKIINLDARPRSQGRARGANRIEYQEILKAPRWLRFSVYGFFGTLIAFYMLAPIWDREANDVLNLTLCMVFVFTLWVIHIFLTLEITLSAKSLRFGYYLLSKEFKYQDILHAEAFRYQVGDYLGWGIRKGTDGSVIYNVPGDQGIAVKIVVREQDQRKVYAFSAKRPEVICKRIQAHLKPLSFPGARPGKGRETAVIR